MEDLSLHILDIVQNSLVAGASEISIVIIENDEKNFLELIIQDNGKGIKKDLIERIVDPFYTTRKTRKIGMGLSLLKQSVEQTGGWLKIESVENHKTTIRAHFIKGHIDMIPKGNIPLTIKTIIMSNPELRLKFFYRYNNETFAFDTNDVKKILSNDISINNSEILNYIYNYISQNLKELENVYQNK